MNNLGLIIDMDGTLIHKGKANKGAVELIDYLKEKGIPFRIITNSVGRTATELSLKMMKVGIKIDGSFFFNPIVALDRYLVENEVSSYIFIGPNKIENTLSVEACYDGTPEYIILSGLEKTNYEQMNKLFQYVKHGAKLLSMSRSEYYIAEEGLMLDTGAFTRLLEYHTNNEALLFGKPSSELFMAAIEDMGLDKKDVCVIGDDVMTDIKGANTFGIDSVLVRTGKYQVKDELIEEPGKIVDSLLEVVEQIKACY